MRTSDGDGHRQVDRSTSDDTEGFQGFYEREITHVLAYLIATTGDRWIAEELAQEAFARAYRDWEDVCSYDNPGGWLHRVAHNLAMSRFRRLRAEAGAMLRLRSMRRPQVEAGSVWQDEGFWAEVRRLPSRQSQAVTLHYLEDRPVAEIAELMGCAEGTAKVHLHRARRRLAERLQTRHEDGGGR